MPTGNSTDNKTSSSSSVLPQPIIHASASALAEVVSCAILTPAEVVKQNAQVVVTNPAEGKNRGKGKLSATAQTISRFRSQPTELWRGYTALAGRNLPFTALQFPLLERLRDGLTEWRDRQRFGMTRGSSSSISSSSSPSPVIERALITAASAGTAGAIAAVVTTPVDVVKTRIMLAAAAAAPDYTSSTSTTTSTAATAKPIPPPSKRLGSFAIAKDILVTEGTRGLWRGGALRAVWTMLGSGLYLGVYEGGRVWLASRRMGTKMEDMDIS